MSRGPRIRALLPALALTLMATLSLHLPAQDGAPELSRLRIHTDAPVRGIMVLEDRGEGRGRVEWSMESIGAGSIWSVERSFSGKVRLLVVLESNWLALIEGVEFDASGRAEVELKGGWCRIPEVLQGVGEPSPGPDPPDIHYLLSVVDERVDAEGWSPRYYWPLSLDRPHDDPGLWLPWGEYRLLQVRGRADENGGPPPMAEVFLRHAPESPGAVLGRRSTERFRGRVEAPPGFGEVVGGTVLLDVDHDREWELPLGESGQFAFHAFDDHALHLAVRDAETDTGRDAALPFMPLAELVVGVAEVVVPLVPLRDTSLVVSGLECDRVRGERLQVNRRPVPGASCELSRGSREEPLVVTLRRVPLADCRVVLLCDTEPDSEAAEEGGPERPRKRVSRVVEFSLTAAELEQPGPIRRHVR